MLLSRRKMLQTLGGVSIAAGANHLLLASVPGLSGRVALLEKAGAPAFPKPDIIRYDAQCFTIHGRDAFIYSACVHYARTPKALWRDRLTKLKQAGFNTIETYVFWNYHEPVEGKVDMTELEDFVALIGVIAHEEHTTGGRFVPELSSADRSLSVSLTGRARSGSNLLEISYEAFGSANGNLEMQELTGISGIRIGSDQKSVEISNIAVQRVPAAMKGREVNPDYVAQSAQRQKLGSGSGHEEYAPAYVWFNAAFAVPETANWFCPCNITIAADRDALLYVNGRFVGYYRTIGPQSSFYLPETFVSPGSEPRNILTVMLAYTDSLNAIKRLVVSPYMEFAARKTDIAMEWPRS